MALLGLRAMGRGGRHPALAFLFLLAAIVPLACSPAVPSPPTGAPPSVIPSVSSPPSELPTEAPDAWADLGALPLPETVATLRPAGDPAGPIAPDSAFELTSTGPEPAAALAERLTVDPETKLTTSPGVDEAHVLVRPATSFPAGSLVRFRLTAVDGTLAGSWAYELDRAPRVVAVLPGVQASEVPITTGVEVAFDQDGIVVTAADFTFQPAVTGRVEMHGRVVAFVPDALLPGTVYSVTLAAGVRRPGSAYALQRALGWSFETAPEGADPRADAWLQAGRVTAVPGTRPTLLIERTDDEGISPPTGGDLTVHRLADRATALEIGNLLSETRYSFSAGRHTVVPTDGLPLVMRASVTFRDLGGSWLRRASLPKKLGAGFYLVTLVANGRPSQTALQVSALAPYVLASRTRTLVWVNDVGRQGPVPGVRVRLADGPTLGRTDSRGILDVATPATLVASSEDDEDRWTAPAPVRARILLLDAPDGHQAYIALDDEGYAIGQLRDGSRAHGWADPSWWSALSTDRLRYRASDTIDAWGIVRARAGLAVPETATVRLLVEEGGATVVAASVRPDARGAFAAKLAVRDLPENQYRLELLVGSTVVADTWVEIGLIRKPAYRLTAEADRWAMLAGTTARLRIGAAFYEGTPAAGIQVAIDMEGEPGAVATVGDDGTVDAPVTVGLPAVEDDGPGQLARREISVRSSAPEEGTIETMTQVVVFRGTRLIDARARVKGTTATVTGTVHKAAIARLNALPTLEAALQADPRGAPVAGAPVRLVMEESWEVRVRTGTEYDPITKQAVPVYESQERKRKLPAVTVRTRADGTYAARIVVIAGRSYQVTATTRDPQGRTIAEEAWAEQPDERATASPLAFGEVGAKACPNECRVGESYTIPLVGTSPLPSGGVNRYLFLVEQEGLRRWSLAASPIHEETFRAGDVPNVVVHAVWFDGRRYVVPHGSLQPKIAPAARALRVVVTADRRLYQPGASATVRVGVSDQAGSPVAATVVVAIVDRRLLDATGGPPVGDPRDLLYAPFGDGVELVAASPAWPDMPTDGKGATGGGDGDGVERSDFRDRLLFTTVATGADGVAEVPVRLSDDLTNWRVAAGAVDGRLRGGVGTGDLRVGLPFFVEATIAPEYLAADRPAVQVRAFGSGITAAAPVTFSVASDTLGMAAVTADGPAGAGVVIPLAPLSPGVHRLTISADDGRHRDSVVRSFRVIETRRTRPVLESWTVTDTLDPGGTAAGFSTFVVSDAGRGAWVPRLYALATDAGTRGDQAVAARAAIQMLTSAFGLDAEALPPVPALDPFLGPDGGVAVLPYADQDLELTVRALLADPAAAGRSTDDWLRRVADANGSDGEEAETPERQSVALSGLAALGVNVLGRIQDRLAAGDVPPREALWLALGAVALGDEATGARVARDLADRFGERSGILVRLAVSDVPNEVSEATGRFAALAAAVANPLAEPALAYALEHPRTGDLAVLEELLAIRGLVARQPAVPTVAAWTVDGTRRTVDLSSGQATAITVTPAQRESLVLEAVEGRLQVVGSWDDLGAPAGSPTTSVSIGRAATPGGVIPRTSLVRVQVHVAFATNAAPGAYRIVELVPSGLAPIDPNRTWEDEAEEAEASCHLPHRVDGQQLEFSVSPDPRQPQPTLCYLARVVTPGTYAWEPATISHVANPATWAATESATLTIR
jgi:hypothetical protein